MNDKRYDDNLFGSDVVLVGTTSLISIWLFSIRGNMKPRKRENRKKGKLFCLVIILGRKR